MLEFFKALGLQKLGHYEFQRQLGGGKAALTCLYETRRGKKLVYKFLVCPRHDREAAQFRREAGVLTELTEMGAFSPRLKREFRHHGPHPVYSFAMEFIEGTLLSTLLERAPAPWPWEKALRLLNRISAALELAHARHICHRDLHAGNIMVTESEIYDVDTESYRDPGIRILDFGAHKDIIKDLYGVWSEDVWRPPGGVSCWSPESLQDPGSIKTSHDMWALGVIFHRLLTGHWPVPAESMPGLRNELLETGEEVRLRHLADFDAPRPVKVIVRVLLSRDPENRYAAGQLTRICEQIRFRGLLSSKDEEIDFFMQHSGDVWVCPNCGKAVAPSGSRCPQCGAWVDDWLPWPW